MPVVDHDLLFVRCLSAGPFYHNLVAGKRHVYFSLLKLHLPPVLLEVVDCLIKNSVIGLCLSLLALIQWL